MRLVVARRRTGVDAELVRITPCYSIYSRKEGEAADGLVADVFSTTEEGAKANAAMVAKAILHHGKLCTTLAMLIKHYDQPGDPRSVYLEAAKKVLQDADKTL